MKPIDMKTRRSGETVKVPGLYTSSCCNLEQTFEAGNSYTRCLKCMSLCVWELDTDAESDYIQPMAA